MGDRDRPKGYSYSYKFTSVGIGDIISRMKLIPKTVPEGDKSFVFEMRTEFFVKWTPEVEQRLGLAGREIIGSERFDIAPIPLDCIEYTSSVLLNDSFFFPRLNDYWMDRSEIYTFCRKAIAFAKRLAAESPHINRFAIAVQIEVCTVQQERESVELVVGRAIYPNKLFPLYLWKFQSAVRRPLGLRLKELLFRLEKIRADSRETAWALMPHCSLCKLKSETGDQIAKLPSCGCAFHYHCVVLKLEKSNQCPLCAAQVYDSALLREPDDVGVGQEI